MLKYRDKNQKNFQIDTKFRDFSYFYMNYLKIKNFWGVFHSDFWCLEGGGGEHHTAT